MLRFTQRFSRAGHFQAARRMLLKRDMSTLRILFGSQSGTAEYFSEQFGQELEDAGVKVSVEDQRKISVPTDLRKGAPIVFMNSCYGQGEPTDSAKHLWDWMFNQARAEEKPLRGLRYTVFGLGSSKTHAKHYNVVGRAIDKRLEELGAVRIFPLGEGDDSECIEEDFEQFSSEFLDFWKREGDRISEESACEADGGESTASSPEAMLSRATKLTGEPLDHDTAAERSSLAGAMRAEVTSPRPSQEGDQAVEEEATQQALETQSEPYAFSVVSNTRITEQRTRPCFELRLRREYRQGLDLDTPWYTSGDHLIVYPHNRSRARRLSLRLGRHPDDTFDWGASVKQGSSSKTCEPSPAAEASTSPAEESVTRVLARMVEFAAPPSPRALRYLADFAMDATEAERLRHLSDKGVYSAYTRQSLRNILDILAEHPSVRISPEELLPLLPRLKPRCYSISSSSGVFAPRGEVHLSYRHVFTPTPRGTLHEGLCTSWLSRLQPASPLHVATGELSVPMVYGAVRPSHFRLPEDPQTPVLFVAGGIGIAPFKAFLEERSLLAERHGVSALGPAYLFRGFRSEGDAMYNRLAQASIAAGTLTGDFLALDAPTSAGAKRQMVHEAMLERSDLVHDVVANGGHVYVCGGATGFGKAVANAVMTSMCNHGNLSEDAAQAQLNEMLGNHKYCEDLSD